MYTTHGHQISGTIAEEKRPESVARCGGPGLCPQCSQEAIAARKPEANIPLDVRYFEELDRNARAYGFEVGRGHPLTEKLEYLSPDNPFMDREWRSRIIKNKET